VDPEEDGDTALAPTDLPSFVVPDARREICLGRVRGDSTADARGL
jgi:hypothetical protein